MPDEKRKLLKIHEVMELCGVSRRTVYLWMKKNKIEYVYTAGRVRRIFYDSLFKDGNVEMHLLRQPFQRR